MVSKFRCIIIWSNGTVGDNTYDTLEQSQNDMIGALRYHKEHSKLLLPVRYAAVIEEQTFDIEAEQRRDATIPVKIHYEYHETMFKLRDMLNDAMGIIS